MRKTAFIVAYGEAEAQTYREQLRSLFLDAVDLRVLVLGPGQRRGRTRALASADLALFPCLEALEAACPDGERPRDVVFAERTLSREGFERLRLAAGAGPLVLFDETRAMAGRMIETLWRIGLPGARIEPAGPDEAPAAGSGTAVVLGRPAPEGWASAIDAGPAYLDVGTIIDFGMRLDLEPLYHRQCIKNSYRELVTVNRGLADVLGKMNRCEGSLDIIVRLVDAGVVSVDALGGVSSCNEQAAALLGVDARDAAGSPARQSFPRIPFQSVLTTKASIVDRVETIGGREIGYSIDPILHSGSLYGAVAVISGKAEPGERRERTSYRIDPRKMNTGYRARYTFDDLVAESEAMRKCRDIAKRTAASASSVLIYGESGTGKEVFAQAIHNASGRRSQPFVAVNCGALPESLLESELFGYEEGAFTGARKGGKPGLFELAHHGTLFLDEMGGMPPSIQTRILRVLEEREVMRLGSDRVIGVDIRVIAATNRDLRNMVAEGSFREDLYYRLNVLPLFIPPLRERPEDLVPLVARFQRQFDFRFELEPQAERLLLSHDWPGNARELRNYVEYIANLGLARVGPEDLPYGEPRISLRPAASTFRSPGPPKAKASPRESAAMDEASAKTAFILDQLDKASLRQERLGRRSLFQAAKERRLYLSEQEIRGILKRLESEALVSIRPGKGGTLITQLGKEALEELRARGVVG